MIEIVLFVLVYAISWSVTWRLVSFFEALTETQNRYIRETDFVSKTISMADLEEITVDQATSTVEDNNVFKNNKVDSKVYIQQVDEQLFFDYFQEQEEKPDELSSSNFKNTEANLPTVNSNNLEFERRSLRKSTSKLITDKENNKTYFIGSITPKVKMTDHQSKICNAEEISKTTSPYKQSETIKCNDTWKEGEWPLLYLDNCDKITNIKCIDSSGFKNVLFDDAKAETSDIFEEKQTRICDRESGKKIILMKNDNVKKFNTASADMTSDLELQYPATNLENVGSSRSTDKAHTNDNMDKLNITFPNIKNDLAQQQTNSNKHGDFFSNFYQPQAHEADETDSTNKLNPSQRDKMSDLEQQYTMSSKEKASFSFSEMHIKDQPGSCDNISSNLASKEQFVECEKYQTNVFDDAKNLESVDLITWEIPGEKSEFQVNRKVNEEHFKEREGNISEKVEKSLKCSENILSLLENECIEDTEDTILKKSSIYYDGIALNSTNNKLLVIGSEKCRANILDETGSLAGVNLIPSEIADVNIKYEESRKENKEISVKHNERKENLFEKYQENVIKRNESSSRIDNKDVNEVQCETKNKECVKQLTESMKSSISTCFESQCDYLFSKSPAYNSTTIQSNCAEEISNLESKCEFAHEVNHRIVEQKTEKSKDRKQSRTQLDSSWSTNNLQVPNCEQILHEKNTLSSSDPQKSMHCHDMREGNVLQNDSVTTQKSFIRKSIVKPPILGKIKDNLFNKKTSKHDLTTADSNSAKTKPCTEQMLSVKSVLDSPHTDKSMHSDELRKVSENGLDTSSKDFVVEMKPKSLPLKNVSDNLSDKMSSKDILIPVGHSSEKAKYEPLKNECNSEDKFHKHDTMIFGLCSECVPAESKKTAKKMRTTKILPNGSFARSYKGERRRKKLKTANEAKAKQFKAPENSAQTIKKKVSFSDCRKIFSYDPEEPVFGAYYTYIDRKEEKHEDGKEPATVPKKVSAEMIDGISNKTLKNATSKISRALPKKETKWTKLADTSTKIKVTHSEIKETALQNKELLAKPEEHSYFENMGYIEDSPPSSLLEIDLIDDDSTPTASFENEEAFLNERNPLINTKNNIFPRKMEYKAKKWFKGVGSSSLKKLSLKKIKKTAKS